MLMKAIIVSQFGGPDVLQLGERARPEAGSGEVLVRLDAVGINPVETYIRSGTYNVKPSLPYTPGTDGAGVIEAVGKKIDRFKRGIVSIPRVRSPGPMPSLLFVWRQTSILFRPASASRRVRALEFLMVRLIGR